MAPHPPPVMVLPFPAQGHVMPLMELSLRLVEHGLEVEFVNTDFNHGRILKALAAEGGAVPDGIHMVSFPDGMGPDGDRADIVKLGGGLPAAMLGGLEETIRAKNIRWVVVDVSMSFALELAATAGVRVALFSTFSAAVFAIRLHIPKLIDDGILDENGNVVRNEMIELSPQMPPFEVADLPWTRLTMSPEERSGMIQNVVKTNPAIKLAAAASVVICNTFQEIEPGALALVTNPLPVGPLESPAVSRSAGQFWPEDPTCLTWLDARDPDSVIYLAFGSFTVFDVAQLQEVADGLALTGRPFLWVVRPNFAAGAGGRGGNGGGEGWLDELRRRVAADGTGLVVDWAPQQRVLAHPSVACFVSHCGWNSTVEGLRHGVPFLCWPYFADQFCNQRYVCGAWGTGVQLRADERGVVGKEEIKRKVSRLLGDEAIRARAAAWKDAARASIARGGSSHRNLLKLVNMLREQ